MSTTFEFVVNDAYIDVGDTVINGIRLRKFQEELFNSLGKYKRILLRAPTGSGKTFTLILAAIKSYLESQFYPVVGIYPSRALVYDQARSVCETLSKMGLKKDGDSFVGRLYINGEDKGGIKFSVYILTSENKAIPSKFQPSDSIPIVFTVPEYPYMFMTAMNRQRVASTVFDVAMKYGFDDAIQQLKGMRGEVRELLDYFSVFFNGHWFIDEFHLYSGISRSSMLTLVEMFEKFNSLIVSNKTIVFSSATPVPINIDKVIEVKTTQGGSKIRKATRVFFHVTPENPQEELVNYVSCGGKKTAVILDRVYYVAELCKKVKDAAVVWGLDKSFGNCRKVDKGLEKEDFIIGNQAMSFGIDLDLDRGYIHAHDAETLIQRFGRFGRHGEGEAEVHIFVDASYKVVSRLKGVKGNLSYDEFLNLVNDIYERRVDDKLDEMFFSKIRRAVLLRAFSLVYAISQGEQVYSIVRKWYPEAGQLKIRPSYEDTFYVFAYRPGSLRGKWCEGGDDELFSMIRNFKYDISGQCFTSEPLKETPGIVPRESKLDNVKCGFYQFEEFKNLLSPKLILKKQGYSVLMGGMKEFKDSYVIVLTRECIDWGDFDKMAKLVSTYENAIPIYKDEGMKSVKGLALFI